jgi:hypothetical protein
MWRTEKAQEATADAMIKALKRMKLANDIVALIGR